MFPQYNPMGPYSGGNPGAVGNAWTAGVPNIIGGRSPWTGPPSAIAGHGGIGPNGEFLAGRAGSGGNAHGQLPGTPGSQPHPIGPYSTGLFGQAPPPSTGAGGSAATPGQPGIGGITTTVQPQPVYTPQQTQWAVNSALSNASQQADPRLQEKQFMSPGVSQDAGKMSAAVPGIAGALFNGRQQAAQIPLMDAFANQQNMLGGQIGQQQEANGLANALAQFNENNIYQQNQMLGPLMSLFGNQMMGGF